MMKIFLLLAPLTLFFHFVSAQKSPSPLQDSINLYVKKNQPARALVFAKEWQEKAIKEVGKEDTLYFMVTNVVGNLMNQAGQNKEAAPLMVGQAEEITKTLGPQSIYLAKCYQILGAIYNDLQEVAKSEESYRKALDLFRAPGKSKSNEEASIINNLGTLFFQAGQYGKAKPLYHEALQIWLQLFGENHKMVGLVYRNLGVINDLESNDAEAETYLSKSISIHTKLGGEDNPEVAMSLGNLGSHYFRMSNYPKAEECYQKSLDIRLKNFGENNNGVALMYTNLAMIQSKLGLFDKAIPGYMKAIDIRKKLLGEDHPRVADVYLALAVTYSDHGKLALAEPFFEKSLAIHQKKLGESHPTTATTLNNFGNLKYRMRKYQDAVKLYQQSLDIRLKVFGENNQYVASCYTNLGTIANDMGEFEKSNQYFRKAIAINLKVVGPYHQDMNVTQYQLARNLYDDQKTEQAMAMLQTGVTNSLKQIDLNFNILSENEKQDYFQNTLKGNLDVTSSLCFQMANQHPQAIELLYNTTISTKALILNATQKFRKRMASSPDSVLRNQYAQWEKNQQTIAAIYQKNDSAELKTLPQLLKTTENLEKDLVKKSADFAGIQTQKRPTWKTIQKKLKKEEAAIELVRLKYYGTAYKAVDSSQVGFPEYQIKGLTDSVVYVAMIIKPGLKWPEMVVFPNGNEMENRHFFLYKNRIQNNIDDQNSFETYWKSIGEKLGPKVKQVFLSPDGIYHSINLNTLWNPNSKKYLLEELEIRQLTNTKDLVTAKANLKRANYACLTGFPDFNLDVGMQKAAVERNAMRSEAIHRLPPTRGEAFMELPGTKVEVEAIQQLLSSKGWKVETLIGQEALEEAIKQTRNPGILHFATHGFFQTSKQNDLNPMLFSGLLLTGANRTFSGESVQEMEDGVLTAYEAMNLNLDQTDLVVLSACETGLGEIKIGEGVYGLQRAFQVAGAKSIIMSLWKVDDEATKELMISFYKNWLSPLTGPLNPPKGDLNTQKAKGSGSSPSGRPDGAKRSAFLAAQKELKAKYPSPYYWGAFVMVGE